MSAGCAPTLSIILRSATTLIYKERVRKGNLRDSYDVIVIPNQGRNSAKSIVFDVESKGKPLAYTKSAEFPSLGIYGEGRMTSPAAWVFQAWSSSTSSSKTAAC